MKLISVIIPTYNRLYILPRAVESVLRQSYSQIELIIVDDGLDDGTAQYLASIKDSRVRYIINNQNQGPAAARNKGVELAEGEWIAFLDSDDVWEPDKLEKQMEALQGRNTEWKMVYCEYAMYRDEECVGIVPDREISIFEKSGDLLEQLLRGPLIGTVTMLIEKEAFLKIGGFCESLQALEDYEFSIRFAERYKIAFVEETLVRVYDSLVSVNKQWEAQIHAYFYITRKFWEQLKEYGILWGKLYLIGKEAESYGYRKVFEREMQVLIEQLEVSKDREKAITILKGKEFEKHILQMEETEEFFVRLEHNKDTILAEEKKIIHKVTHMLQQSDVRGLVALNDCFRDGIDKQVYIHCGNIQRLYTINCIIKAEQETGEPLFISGVNDYDELMQKYRNLVYYLRRFELSASDEGCREGVDFLSNSCISVIAVYRILQKEIFANKVRLICRCCDMLAGKREDMRIGLLLCMAETEPITPILLRIAEWNVEMGNAIEALRYLEKIEEMDDAIIRLRNELTEKIYGRK